MKKIIIFINIIVFISITNSFANGNIDNQKQNDVNHNLAVISQAEALNSGIKTNNAKSQIINETISLIGKITLDPDRFSEIRARFPGIIKNVNIKLGQKVKKGQLLAIIESNDSLRSYSINSPINGIIIDRNINIGNIAKDEFIFKIADLSKVWAKLHIFPKDIKKISQDQEIIIKSLDNEYQYQTKISFILPVANNETQTLTAIAIIENEDSIWKPEINVTGEVKTLDKVAKIAVEQEAIQRVENQPVIFIKKDKNQYEMRNVKIGKGDNKFIEIIDGLELGEEYVSHNSFIVKSEIFKKSADH